jgi:organic radical activating enzyme
MQTGTLHTTTTTALPVMESFYTIQGEGFYQGTAAYFIRLGGCDVGCVWCDVKESWDAERHPRLEINNIVGEAMNHPGRLAVVTGGEPLMHDCYPLTEALHNAGFATNIETSGSYPLSGNWDWICLSPKKFKAPLPEILPLANELKVVIFNKSDFAWAEKICGIGFDRLQTLFATRVGEVGNSNAIDHRLHFEKSEVGVFITDT